MSNSRGPEGRDDLEMFGLGWELGKRRTVWSKTEQPQNDPED